MLSATRAAQDELDSRGEESAADPGGALVAGTQAIAAVSQAVKAILESSRSNAGYLSIPIEIYQLPQLANPMSEGVALTLYRVAINGNVRALPPRVGADGRRFRPSLPVDLHYLLTSWGRSAERQQELLGWALRTLDDTPILSASLLNQGQAVPVFRPDEGVDLVATSLAMAELGAIWEVAKAATQVSMAYQARLVQLDSQLEMPTQPLVQTRVVASEGR